MNIFDMEVFHYYEKEFGPFASICQLPLEQAIKIKHKNITNEEEAKNYLRKRVLIESLMHKLFIKKDGKPVLDYSIYFMVGRNDKIIKNYKNTEIITLKVKDLNPKRISFTYSDSFYAFTRKDNHPTRRKLYIVDEISDIMNKFGLLENEDYIEMQLWDDKI